MRNLEEEIVENDEILNIVNEIKILRKQDRYNNISIKDLKNDYPDKIKKLKEAFFNYIGEIYVNILKKRNSR